MTMSKLSKVSFFLFVSAYNYIWFRIIIFNSLYNRVGNMGFLYTIILAVLMLLFFSILPKKLINKDYRERFNKSYFKFLYSTILLLESIFSISFCAYLLSKVFIPKANFLIIITGIILAILILSKFSPKDVIELSTLFNIAGYSILLFSFIFLPNLDLSVLLPFQSINWLIILFFLWLIISDNLTLILNKKDISFNKLNFILGIFIAVFFLALEYFLLICIAGVDFFKDINWVGFICFSIEPVSRYIGSFDFAYIFYILVSCIFKYAYNTSLVRDSINISSKAFSFIIALTFLSLGILSYYTIPMDNQLLMIACILISLSGMVLFWMLKECYFVRTTKE